MQTLDGRAAQMHWNGKTALLSDKSKLFFQYYLISLVKSKLARCSAMISALVCAMTSPVKNRVWQWTGVFKIYDQFSDKTTNFMSKQPQDCLPQFSPMQCIVERAEQGRGGLR